MSSSLYFRHVGKTFRTKKSSVQALRDVSFDVPDGQFTAIVGPSGCGKSTLLSLAAGLDTDFEGQIDRPKDASYGFLFQTPRLLPWLTAEKNVTFILKTVQGKTSAEAKEIARHYLHLVGLHGFEDRFPNELSGGMQQRVALVRALVVEPRVMFMDEPFAALDELTARQMRTEVLRLVRAAGCTVLLVTHNVLEAVYMSDRIVIMGARPGTVRSMVEVDMPHPRDYEDPEIASLSREVINHLYHHQAM